MRKGDEALYWLEGYFNALIGYEVTLRIYGPSVPSNNIAVVGPDFFRFNYCPSWVAPQVSCALTKDVLQILNDIQENIILRATIV